jgi:hypothetical protein
MALHVLLYILLLWLCYMAKAKESRKGGRDMSSLYFPFYYGMAGISRLPLKCFVHCTVT